MQHITGSSQYVDRHVKSSDGVVIAEKAMILESDMLDVLGLACMCCTMPMWLACLHVAKKLDR